MVPAPVPIRLRPTHWVGHPDLDLVDGDGWLIYRSHTGTELSSIDTSGNYWYRNDNLYEVTEGGRERIIVIWRVNIFT